MSTSTAPAHTGQVTARLSTLDRFLPLWIIAAMAAGLLLGRLVPGIGPALDSIKVSNVSLPIAVGLLVMMYPVLANVRYNETRAVVTDRKLMITSLTWGTREPPRWPSPPRATTLNWPLPWRSAPTA